jgi:hypothetical protein
MNPRVLIGFAALALIAGAGLVAVRSASKPPATGVPRASSDRGVPAHPDRRAKAQPASIELAPVELIPPKPAPRLTSRPANPEFSTASQPPTRGLLGSAPPGQADVSPDDFPDDDEPVVPLPLARASVGFVGVDPDAEAVWLLAINDPTLSPEERKDLIEDLNQDGFPDPKDVTIDDLPLILSRIELIEEVGPDAMDDTNAAAFAEAYKDLVDMLTRLTQQHE